MLTDVEQNELIRVVDVMRTIAQTFADESNFDDCDLNNPARFHGYIEGQLQAYNSILDWFAKQQAMLLENRSERDSTTDRANNFQGMCSGQA